jgi:hypothetical protein
VRLPDERLDRGWLPAPVPWGAHAAADGLARWRKRAAAAIVTRLDRRHERTPEMASLALTLRAVPGSRRAVARPAEARRNDLRAAFRSWHRSQTRQWIDRIEAPETRMRLA